MSHKTQKSIPKKYEDLSVHKLIEEQILMLKLSDEDIKQGRLIPHNEVMKNSLDWLKELK